MGEEMAAYTAGMVEGQGSRNSDGGMGGFGAWIWPLVILALLFGGGGFGFGGFGGGGGGAGFQGMATRADINEAFALNNITGGITAIQQGIADSTYALNNSVTNLGYNVQTGFNGISREIAECCCQTGRAIDGVNYNMATQFSTLGNTVQSGLRDVIDNQNANYRGLMDFLVQEKLSSKDAQIAQLQTQVGRAEQNAVLGARIDAAVAELLRRTGNDCPTAAYLVQPPTPVNFPTNGCGTVQFGGYNGGCGCGLAA